LYIVGAFEIGRNEEAVVTVLIGPVWSVEPLLINFSKALDAGGRCVVPEGAEDVARSREAPFRSASACEPRPRVEKSSLVGSFVGFSRCERRLSAGVGAVVKDALGLAKAEKVACERAS